MTKFIQYDIPNCTQLNLPTGRVYETPDGNRYPSVTTVLASAPNQHLTEWRERVGTSVADQISKAAAVRGTKIHNAIEAYLLGKPFQWGMTDGVAREMYTNMLPYVDVFQEVHALEQRLWCDTLKVAGSVDCIAKINDVMYVVDFKTSGRFKNAAEIDSYFMQTAAYAMMWFSRTGMIIDRVRVLITTQDDGVLVYDEEVKKWLQKFVQLRRHYK